MEQNRHHHSDHSKVWKHQNQNCDRSVFFICVPMGSIEEPPGTFYLGGWAISSITNRQMRAEIAWVTTVKKLVNQSGSFENTLKLNCFFLE